MTAPVRSLVLWLPDWPITALALGADSPVDIEAPVAVTHDNTVIACSAAARADGVRRGQRRRDAQALSPRVALIPADPHRDERAFLPLMRRLEELAPGVQILRPGLCALRARGPARYYGGEDEAARVLITALLEASIPDVRAGIADGPFTAEHAARAHAARPVLVVPPGESARFLAPLPVTVLGDDALADMLGRLGVRSLGEFAALDPARVRDRLSEHGARLQALARGADSRPVVPRIPPPELVREVTLEPALELADQVAFAVRQTCDDVIAALAAIALVCTEVRIELHDDRGHSVDRLWLHPTCFDSPALVDRVRWQLQSVWDAPVPVLTGGIAAVRVIPETVDDSAHHQPGLFGQGSDARLHHALSRVQGLLGHQGVVLPSVIGGRRLNERQSLVPWGDRIVPARERDRPWPGHLRAPLPTTVMPDPRPAQVVDGEGAAVSVDERGSLIGTPVQLSVAGEHRRRITSWAGPWPLHERIWDTRQNTHAHRFQFVADDDTAWLMLLEDDGWHVEGRYD